MPEVASQSGKRGSFDTSSGSRPSKGAASHRRSDQPARDQAAARALPAHNGYTYRSHYRASVALFTTAARAKAVLVVRNFPRRRPECGKVVRPCSMRFASRGDTAGIRVRLVSGPGLHASLRRFVSLPGWTPVGPASSLPECYREAWVARTSVPRHGSEGDDPQAWTCGCSVVCSQAAAATMGAPDAVLAGHDASQIVNRLLELGRSPDTRRRLVGAGLKAVATMFDPDKEEASCCCVPWIICEPGRARRHARLRPQTALQAGVNRSAVQFPGAGAPSND